MTEEEASIAYWNAIHELQEVINGGCRGSKGEVILELEDDLDG